MLSYPRFIPKAVRRIAVTTLAEPTLPAAAGHWNKTPGSDTLWEHMGEPSDPGISADKSADLFTSGEHRTTFPLNGPWRIRSEAPGGGRYFGSDVPEDGWEEACVPCTVQAALLARGKIPDPYFGRNSLDCLWMEEREWWFRREFTLPEEWRERKALLVFHGVDYLGEFWLNGRSLGRHEGMFGGPCFDVSENLRPGEVNVLAVRLDPVPRNWQAHLKTSVLYGWHYGRYGVSGIWRDVELVGYQAALIEDASVVSRKVTPERAVIEVRLAVFSASADGKAVVSGRLTGVGFEQRLSFRRRCRLRGGRNGIRIRIVLESPRLWWPHDLGGANRYRCELALESPGGEPQIRDGVSFAVGIKSVAMLPARGKKRGQYDWILSINGRKCFIRGANWCFPDSLLRLDEKRYRPLLHMARDAGINLLRVWGGGIVETRQFYDLCDRLGIMVWQEFPLTHPVSVGRKGPPAISLAVLKEQATAVVKRLRSRASLVIWTGGNEHGGRGKAVDLLERLCRRLDPDRPFHRASPFGGDSHDWSVYHNFAAVTDYTKNPTPLLSEFGLPSPPQRVSLERFLHPGEGDIWPPRYGGSFLHHTPEYGASPDMPKLLRYAGQYGDVDDLGRFIRYSQTSQAVALRTGIEHMLDGMLETTGGVLFYKLGENSPGISWSVIDWYGLPKPAFYFVKRAYEPQHIFCRYDRSSWFAGERYAADVRVASSADAPGPYRATAAICDGRLLPVHEQSQELGFLRAGTRSVMSLSWKVPADGASPFFVCLRLQDGGGATVSREVYWYNFDNTLAHQSSWKARFDDFADRMGCLDRLPRTRLILEPGDPQAPPRNADQGGTERRIAVKVGNTGSFSAFFVTVRAVTPSGSTDGNAERRLRYSDNCFWLDAGEERRVVLTAEEAFPRELRLEARAWNSPAAALDLSPEKP